MTNYLISLGHRRIVHFAGGERYKGTSERIAGFLAAMSEAGIDSEPSLVVPGFYVTSSGSDRAKQLIESSAIRPLPTAIFCGSDAVALGAMQRFSERGIRVPEDISIAGFDDSLVAKMSPKQITTVKQPLHAIGRAAVELLLEQIDLDQPDHSAVTVGRSKGRVLAELVDSGAVARVSEHNDVHFRGELVIRDSVGPPRKRDEVRVVS